MNKLDTLLSVLKESTETFRKDAEQQALISQEKLRNTLELTQEQLLQQELDRANIDILVTEIKAINHELFTQLMKDYKK